MARVGLLEDNLRIAKLCVTMLNYAKHEVTIYMDAQECLQELAIFDFFPLPSFPVPEPDISAFLPIDVLILDLHLPSMHGLDVLRRLRNHPRTAALPLIFCTAAPLTEINQALAIAPDAMLVEKPFKLQTLVQAISDSLLTESHPS